MNMKNKLLFNRIAFISLSILELFIYIVFLSIDIFSFDINTIFIKYSGIILLFLYSFLNYKKWDIEHISFRIAYLFTVLADLFLLVLNSHFIVGVSFFIIAQINYFIYLNHDTPKKRISAYIIMYVFICSILISSISIILKSFEPLYFVVVLYFILLIINTISSFNKKNKHGIRLFIGFILFILCDINVGLNNLEFVLNNNILYSFVSVAMWMFYLPSQYLIVNSLDKMYDKISKRSTI